MIQAAQRRIVAASFTKYTSPQIEPAIFAFVVQFQPA
jgi:hypothetical protein